MKEITTYNETTLTIFKLLREANRWYSDALAVGEFKVANVRGLTPMWRPHEGRLTILMDTDHRTYATIEWTPKDGELFIQDVKFRISEAAVDHDEMLEHMLIGTVRLYSKFKDKQECIVNQSCLG